MASAVRALPSLRGRVRGSSVRGSCRLKQPRFDPVGETGDFFGRITAKTFCKIVPQQRDQFVAQAPSDALSPTRRRLIRAWVEKICVAWNEPQGFRVCVFGKRVDRVVKTVAGKLHAFRIDGGTVWPDLYEGETTADSDVHSRNCAIRRVSRTEDVQAR